MQSIFWQRSSRDGISSQKSDIIGFEVFIGLEPKPDVVNFINFSIFRFRTSGKIEKIENCRIGGVKSIQKWGPNWIGNAIRIGARKFYKS